MKTAYCFDLDGTITKEEILPLLAKQVGLYEEIQALTEATIKGLIPFRRSFLLRCRLLSEIPVSKVRSIIFKIPKYEEIVSFIRQNRENCFLITGNLDCWINPLADYLGCQCYHSIADVVDDKLIKVQDVLCKGKAMKEIKSKFDHTVAIGDGMGDVPMFEEADVRVAFGGVHRPIETLIKMSDYITFDEGALCRLLNTL